MGRFGPVSDLLRVRDAGPDDAPHTVVDVTMTNPAQRNALSATMLGELAEILEAAASQGARALVLRAEPGATTWSAGFDITELPVDGTDPLTWTNPLEGFLHGLRRTPFPVIAAIEGGVWGGATELALTCDLVVATRTSTVAITPVRLGIPYNTAGVAHVLSALPLNVGREMFYTGDPVSAVDLAACGVVSRLVDDGEELATTALDLARRIALRAPLAVRAIKGEITALTDARSLTSDDFERLTALRRAAWTSEDYQEGVRAFREKRSPRFTGE
jgi:methylmalonyl-CoA decarboxylase